MPRSVFASAGDVPETASRQAAAAQTKGNSPAADVSVLDTAASHRSWQGSGVSSRSACCCRHVHWAQAAALPPAAQIAGSCAGHTGMPSPACLSPSGPNRQPEGAACRGRCPSSFLLPGTSCCVPCTGNESCSMCWLSHVDTAWRCCGAGATSRRRLQQWLQLQREPTSAAEAPRRPRCAGRCPQPHAALPTPPQELQSWCRPARALSAGGGWPCTALLR